MANAVAQTIGAQLAFPGRQVISLSGDGGFAMLMGDFLSLKQLNLPVKVVVFNNGALGFIELEQKSTGFIPTGTELQNPNFAAMAEAVGIRGIRLEDPSDVETGIAEALAHERPGRRVARSRANEFVALGHTRLRWTSRPFSCRGFSSLSPFRFTSSTRR